MKPSHRWPIRIYYEDTDHGGVVYHANYLRYMERARTELLRAANIELNQVQEQWGVIFAVTKLAIDYLQPAHFNDALEVISTLHDVRGARLAYTQTVVRCDLQHTQLTKAEVKLACIDSVGRACRIPSPLLQLLYGISTDQSK
ncbi:MAG: tol-pal system-associated acyl-CoA thioesterase [Mariprofundales bacterium]|nr:tol-pal system-associated acyl-CoA thioesterase [Mariprofundales bacterium]